MSGVVKSITAAGGLITAASGGLADYADIQATAAASVLLGRGASGAGTVQEITLGPGLSMSGSTLSASGGVTSVGLSLPAELTVSGSPVTTSGTLTAVWATRAANVVFAGPTSGGSATPGFRALVAADVPSLDAAKITTGTLGVTRGGTGAGTLTAHGILLGEGTSAVVATAAMTDGQLLVGQTGADPLPKTVSGSATLAPDGTLSTAGFTGSVP